MDLYEYQGKELFRRFGIPVSDGRLAETPGGGARCRRGARRPGRRQGAGADRRPRQGGRDQARRRPRRGRGARGRDPRARHPRPRRPQALGREGLGHREGVLPLGHVRPRREAGAVHVHEGGRRRHRGGRRGAARGARAPARRPARRLPAFPRPPPPARRRDRRPGRGEADRDDRRAPVRRLRRQRRDALRDQPADRHARRAR